MDGSCRWYIKNNICKHSIGISRILNIPECEIPLSAKNIPIAEKRKPRRPAKAKQALIVHRNLVSKIKTLMDNLNDFLQKLEIKQESFKVCSYRIKVSVLLLVKVEKVMRVMTRIMKF
ncbi:hypothetical protein BpHYR1_033748 [Brachionus plicatilis]|uniref:SWIM-type domain-containing protein n=1 Tax=Brachionus plicatilis TaxID=10195 RepID=A0A3M7T274_BRAPC|nr:hypothetical protein BpHYR1_033748 [Brachionus plicatilis]